MTKRESKVRAADQIVRLNPDIFGDVILRASDISLLIDTAGLILEVIYNTENKNLGDIDHWRTRNIRDFITKESGIKLEEILNLSSSENEKIEKDIKFIFTASKISSIDIKITIIFFLFKKIPITPKKKIIAPKDK